MRSQLLALDHLVQLMDPQLYLHLQSADSTNFFFFFRMLLVWYKREFEWGDVLRLWEALWTDYYSSSFHLFIALAILEKHRDVIMDHLKHFDEVLKYSKSALSTFTTVFSVLTTLQSTSSLIRWTWFRFSHAPNRSSVALSDRFKQLTRKITSPPLLLTSADPTLAVQTRLERANPLSAQQWGPAAAFVPLRHFNKQLTRISRRLSLPNCANF